MILGFLVLLYSVLVKFQAWGGFQTPSSSLPDTHTHTHHPHCNFICHTALGFVAKPDPVGALNSSHVPQLYPQAPVSKPQPEPWALLAAEPLGHCRRRDKALQPAVPQFPCLSVWTTMTTANSEGSACLMGPGTGGGSYLWYEVQE